MVRVSILALQQAVLASVADAKYMFTKVNEFLEQSGKRAVFDVKLVGLETKVMLQEGVFSIHPEVQTAAIRKTDLIIIPSMSGNMLGATYLNKGYAPFITQQYKKGATVASLCAGAFLLAYTGLLNGRPCTTHWQYADEFRSYYPAANLVDNKILTGHHGLYTSGGNSAYWNLLLHLVEKYTDREMAIRTAKFFMIDLTRSSQSPYTIFNGSKDHEDKAVKQAQIFIERHYGEKVTVDQLASKLQLSRRTLERRFKKATSNTVIAYIQRVKIEAAKKQLETGRKTVDEIMHEAGYTDIQAFRDVFRKITDLTPVAYRDKYQQA